MQIVFYTNFEKKKNSTKRPTVGGEGNLTNSFTVTGTLKEPCSIMTPVIAFQGQPLSPNQIFSTHYAYIPQFGKYYFVKDWTYIEGLWEAEMEEDVLATWKTHIGDSTLYVLRTNAKGESQYWNGSITDTTYPATSDFVIDRTQFTSPFVNTESSGVYVVGIIGSDNYDAVGAITYYAMTPAQFGSLKATLFGVDGLEAMGLVDNQGNWTVTDVGEQFFKTMYNPFQYIVSCFWFPVSPNDITGSSVTSLKIGWWIYTVSAKRISQKIGAFFDQVKSVPPHPQAGTRGRYLNFAPYTQHTLYGKFGSIPIDPAFFDLDESIEWGYKYIVIKYTVDYVTGQCLTQIYTARYTDHTDLQLIHKTEFLLGVPIQLAQIGMDYMGAVSTALNSATGTIHNAIVGSAMGGVVGGVAGAITGMTSGIYDTLQSAMPQLKTSGSNGSFINLAINTELISKYYVIAYEDIEHKGRPLCLPVKISLLEGFVLCADGEIDIDCLDDEREEISNFLTTGFFWE